MRNPFTLLPYMLAASGKAIDGISTNSLVAAGFTLLQRSAPLVRALASSRPALLLPPGAAWLTALAACDGHVALILDQRARDAMLSQQLQSSQVGVVFSVDALADRVPAGLTTVLLDEVPAFATVHSPDTARRVDLGSHTGLRLEGRTDAPLADDAVIAYLVDGTEVTFSHAQALADNGPLAWLVAAP